MVGYLNNQQGSYRHRYYNDSRPTLMEAGASLAGVVIYGGRLIPKVAQTMKNIFDDVVSRQKKLFRRTNHQKGQAPSVTNRR